MRTTAHRLRRGFAVATVISAIAVPAAAAAPVDPPIPGAPDEPQQSQPSHSQPYPGSVTALSPPESTSTQPSQREPYPGSVTALSPPESTPVTVQVEPRTVAGDGFDWGDAGIGASVVLALAAIAGGAAIAVGHSSRRGHKLA